MTGQGVVLVQGEMQPIGPQLPLQVLYAPVGTKYTAQFYDLVALLFQLSQAEKLFPNEFSFLIDPDSCKVVNVELREWFSFYKLFIEARYESYLEKAGSLPPMPSAWAADISEARVFHMVDFFGTEKFFSVEKKSILEYRIRCIL